MIALVVSACTDMPDVSTRPKTSDDAADADYMLGTYEQLCQAWAREQCMMPSDKQCVADHFRDCLKNRPPE